MHLEVLVEDASGKKALESLIPKIAAANDTYKIHAYKGIGRVPPNMRDPRDARKRILLDNLPKLLRGYGKTFAGRLGYDAAVVLVCDLDTRDLTDFLSELKGVLEACDPRPETRFCLAIEEGEAWLLGDLLAILSAYPNAKREVLTSYVNDSICGTWERLADAVHHGGAQALNRKGWQAIGEEKSKWATEICPRMDVENNASPSFQFFRDTLKALSRRY